MVFFSFFCSLYFLHLSFKCSKVTFTQISQHQKSCCCRESPHHFRKPLKNNKGSKVLKMQTDWRIEAKLYCVFTFLQLLFLVQNAPKASEAQHKKEEYVFPFELQALRLLEDSHISLTSFKTDVNETCRVKDVSHVCFNNRSRKDESPRRLPLVPLFPATTSISQQTPSFNTRSLSDSVFLEQPLNLTDCIQNLTKICI